MKNIFKEISLFYNDYINTIDWSTTCSLYSLLVIAMLIDNPSIIRLVSLTAIFLLATILSYVKKKSNL